MRHKTRKNIVMKILKAISTEKGNEGKVLGTNKLPKIINGKLTPVYLTKEDFVNKIYNSVIDSFEVVEVEI